MFAGRIAQNDRIRFDVRRRAGEAHFIHARLEVERHGVAHDGEVLVVDGQRRLGGGNDTRPRAGGKKDKDEFVHNGIWLTISSDICH